ncbi:MAG TPA: LemA family protein [Thermoplasmatales archaeon]|nr:LemA family protein [Thermoplasmatales archaeon]
MIYIIGMVILVVVIIFLLYMIAVYNKFKRLKNAGEATLGQIKVALKKRIDMLSELVESVKSYAKFEKSTLENITKMRSEVMKGGIKDIKKIEGETRRLLGDIKIMVENYPELKTSESVKKLMEETSNVENEIARHRYTYNNIVQEYNTMRDVVPSSMIASIFSFSKMEYLEFEEIGKPSLRWEV